MSTRSPVGDRLRAHGQTRLAEYLERSDADVRARLTAQIDGVDLALMQRLVSELAVPAPSRDLHDVRPASITSLIAPPTDPGLIETARERGEAHLRDGSVAVVLLAGGQGSRLGFSGPKGAFPYAPVTGRSLFWRHAAAIDAIRTRYRCRLAWYVLTSPANDAETRALFARHDFFGLGERSIRFVVQGTLPVVDAVNGDFLLRAPDTLALAPDGHGGVIGALGRAGALAEMAADGVESVFTFQVDNPLTAIARPELLGLRLVRQADIASVAVRKSTPQEPIGTFAAIAGRTCVLEYIDLPASLATACVAQGEPLLWAGSINVHCIARALLDDVARHVTLPHHRAVKAVPHTTYAGAVVAPDRPNAVKFETFLFDVLAIAGTSVVAQVDRAEEFSPIKNAEGPDSSATCRRDANARFARWLEAAGVVVPRQADGAPVYDIEIDPRLALDAEELAARLPPGLVIDGPLVLDAPHTPNP